MTLRVFLTHWTIVRSLLYGDGFVFGDLLLAVSVVAGFILGHVPVSSPR
jgi:hypothetical protein